MIFGRHDGIPCLSTSFEQLDHTVSNFAPYAFADPTTHWSSPDRHYLFRSSFHPLQQHFPRENRQSQYLQRCPFTSQSAISTSKKFKPSSPCVSKVADILLSYILLTPYPLQQRTPLHVQVPVHAHVPELHPRRLPLQGRHRCPPHRYPALHSSRARLRAWLRSHPTSSTRPILALQSRLGVNILFRSIIPISSRFGSLETFFPPP